MFPLNIAIKLPIYIYGKAKFRELNGTININAPIKRGMIKIGKMEKSYDKIFNYDRTHL